MFRYDCLCDNLGNECNRVLLQNHNTVLRVDNFKFDPLMRTPVLKLVVPVDVWKPKCVVLTHVEGKFGREQCRLLVMRSKLTNTSKF